MAWLVIHNNSNTSFVLGNEFLKYGNITVYKKFSQRFSDDKILYHDSNRICLADGVILNKTELLEQDNSKCLIEWISRNIAFNTETVFGEKLRGPFSGFYYDIKSNTLQAFGNQTGDTAVFYYSGIDFNLVSSDFNLIFDFCKVNKIELSFNKTAANHILSLGFVVEGNTFANEIRRVKPGEFVTFQDNLLPKESFYHRFDNTKVLDITIEEAVDMLDDHFRKAVKRCFDKDLEYSYNNHLVDLSGGLDSRMTTWVAKEMGYRNITNICYTKSGSPESEYAGIVSKILKNDFIFKQLDDLNFFYDIEEIVRKNYGLSYYNGITGGNRLLKSLNFEYFGLEHTGQLGDVIVGSFNKELINHSNNNVDNMAYSQLHRPFLKEISLFKSNDLFQMYYRGFQGALTTHYIRRYYTEAVSPFIDVDFMSFCFSIPLKYRMKHLLYWKWVQDKYPKASLLPSTRIPFNKKDYSMIAIGRKLVGKNKQKILNLLTKAGLGGVMYKSNSINPFNHWYYSDKKLRDYMQKYYENNVKHLNAYPEIQQMLKASFNAERTTEKLLALTVLGVYRVYFLTTC